MLFIIIFFFFFQAEDGIRDLIVTGVQTCALPISSDFTGTWNEAFKAHWAHVPFTAAEHATMMQSLEPLGALETSVIAYRDGRPAGVVWATSGPTAIALTNPGREIGDSERLNFLGIGVREEHRGRGVNMAMAGYAYLEL